MVVAIRLSLPKWISWSYTTSTRSRVKEETDRRKKGVTEVSNCTAGCNEHLRETLKSVAVEESLLEGPKAIVVHT